MRWLMLLGGIWLVLSLWVTAWRWQTPDSPWIAFIAFVDQNWELFLIRPNGTHLTRLTHTPLSGENAPTWSPDGKWLAFSANFETKREIFRLALNRHQRERLTTLRALSNNPNWSPDGASLVFINDSTSSREIFRYDFASQIAYPITTSALYPSHPKWSPDGNWIVFDGRLDLAWDLQRIRADGSDWEQLTDNLAFEQNPSWSPDGTGLLYEANYKGGYREIYWLSLNDSTPIQITQHNAEDSQAVWSPNGDWIAIVSERDSLRPAIYRLSTKDLPTEIAERITPPQLPAEQPAWSPIISLPWQSWVILLPLLLLTFTSKAPIIFKHSLQALQKRDFGYNPQNRFHQS